MLGNHKYCMETTIVGWGIPEIFAEVRITEALPPITSGSIALAVQCFYTWRIHKFGRGSKIVTSVAIFITLVPGIITIAGAISVTVVFNNLGRVPGLMYKLHLSMELWLSLSLVCDSLIAFTMLALLLRTRHRSIHSGSISNAVSGVHCIPDFLLHLAALYMLYAIYANVLLATLNGRDRARKYAMTSLYTADILSARARVRLPAPDSDPSAIEYQNPDRAEQGLSEIARRVSKSCADTTQDIFLTTGSSGSDDATSRNETVKK
ncbi:hypothetical protein BDQ17DRAFT_1539090 [Cyathus striatus]|nr:hypothetical protein BDQ17DRAFT_1539090 [Cyathus striatus]